MTRRLTDLLWSLAVAVMLGFCVICFLAFCLAIAYLWALLGWT